METVRYPSETVQPKAKAKAKARPKAKAKAAPRAVSAETVRYPSQEPVLPTEEEAEKTEVMLTTKKTRARLSEVKKKPKVLNARSLAEKVGKDEKPKPVAKAKGRPRQIPSAGSQGGKKPVIRKVRITAGPPEAMGVLRRGRGRPKGAVGKAKRDSAQAAA